MTTLDLFIAHLENLREQLGRGDIPVTVPIDKGDNIVFEPIMALADVNVYEAEIDGKKYQGIFINAHGALAAAETVEE